MVRKDLQWDNIQQPLQAIDGFRDADRLAVRWNSFISLAAQDDRLRFSGSDLSISGLDFRIKRILSHDNYDGHVLIDQGERAMFEFSSKDAYQNNSGKKGQCDSMRTFRVHVTDFFDFERSFEAGSIPERERQSETKQGK
jgi:hypothetical protein